ncbi:hypothetical protein LTR85_010684 [Meristemomyces frigidus]|nr:hypothetical protein LTR85_010684 [Meristemomyces frigidus]
MPAYLTAEQLLAYLPEDLYYDNLWRVLGTFAKAFVADTITAQCGTLLDLRNIRTREHSVCKERAAVRSVDLSQFKKDTLGQRLPSSDQAGTDAEARTDVLISADEYALQHAMHQTPAVVFVAHLHGTTDALQTVHAVIKSIDLRDRDEWGVLRAGAIPKTADEGLQQGLGLLAEFGTGDATKAAFVLHVFFPYLTTLAKSEEDLDCWKPSPRAQLVSVMGMSDEELADYFNEEAELRSSNGTLSTLRLLRKMHLSSGVKNHDVTDIYRVFTNYIATLPEEIDEAAHHSLVAGEKVSLDVVIALLDALGEWLEQAEEDDAEVAAKALNANMKRMQDTVLGLSERVVPADKK